MHATLHFNLPEDSYEFQTATDASKIKCAISEMQEFLRQKLKWEDLNDEEYKAYDSLRNKIWEILKDRNIDLD